GRQRVAREIQPRERDVLAVSAACSGALECNRGDVDRRERLDARGKRVGEVTFGAPNLQLTADRSWRQQRHRLFVLARLVRGGIAPRIGAAGKQRLEM